MPREIDGRGKKEKQASLKRKKNVTYHIKGDKKKINWLIATEQIMNFEFNRIQNTRIQNKTKQNQNQNQNQNNRTIEKCLVKLRS